MAVQAADIMLMGRAVVALAEAAVPEMMVLVILVVQALLIKVLLVVMVQAQVKHQEVVAVLAQ